MPLVAPLIKKKVEAALLAGFTKEFPKEASADPTSYQRMAAAISEMVPVLIESIVTQAEVLPGIATAGSPPAHVSVAPGKIT